MPTKSLKKKLHKHGCVQCKNVYEDVCNEIESDRICAPCVSGIPSIIQESRRPTQCCLEHSRPARKEDIETFRLAGASSWFICTTCRRVQVYNPVRRSS